MTPWAEAAGAGPINHVLTHRKLASIPNACVRRVIVPLPLAMGGIVATTQRRILAETMSDATDPSSFSWPGAAALSIRRFGSASYFSCRNVPGEIATQPAYGDRGTSLGLGRVGSDEYGSPGPLSGALGLACGQHAAGCILNM